jgi:hypothetical protein
LRAHFIFEHVRIDRPHTIQGLEQFEKVAGTSPGLILQQIVSFVSTKCSDLLTRLVFIRCEHGGGARLRPSKHLPLLPFGG